MDPDILHTIESQCKKALYVDRNASWIKLASKPETSHECLQFLYLNGEEISSMKSRGGEQIERENDVTVMSEKILPSKLMSVCVCWVTMSMEGVERRRWN